MATINIEIPEGKKATWQTIDGKQMLVLIDDKPKDITERIKTFDDAKEELGCGHPYVRAYIELSKTIAQDDTDLLAYIKLRIIVAALNEGWEPQFTTDEHRYYPWFYLYTQEEIDQMDEEDKKGLLLWGGCAYHGSYDGLASSNSNISFTYSNSSLGARLALKSSKLAKYCGKQFVDIWKDYVYVAPTA